MVASCQQQTATSHRASLHVLACRSHLPLKAAKMQSLSSHMRSCTRLSKEQRTATAAAAANPSRCLLQQQQQRCCLPPCQASSSNSWRTSRSQVSCRALPGGSNNPQQQTDYERDQLRQQGGYNYAPPRSNQPPPPRQQQQQQQQQPWSWGQQQQQQPWSAADPAATKAGGAGRGGNGGGGGSNGDGEGGLSGYTKALIAAAFVTGLGAGVYFDAEINLSPNQVSKGGCRTVPACFIASLG
jgi:hypothetical protein